MLSIDRISNTLISKVAPKSTRRSFLTRSAVVASALVVAPKDFVLRPLTAMSVICGCANLDCECGSPCCNGYTFFCCSINGGLNVCPKGTFIGGWWKADGSTYCAGPRYYMDCNSYCSCNTISYENFCEPSCDGLSCECGLNSCANMAVGCNQFRYGQCHQEIPISGRILCRVITCIPPWEIDGTCTQTMAVDDSTAEHNAPCLEAPEEFVAIGSTITGNGYWIVNAGGDIISYGDATYHGGGGGNIFGEPIVSMAITPSGKGYWLAGNKGDVFAYGDAAFLGSLGNETLVFEVVGIANTPSGKGYWMATSDGAVYSFGDAIYHGGVSTLALAAPIISIVADKVGSGYWLVGGDGGVFAFGDAQYYGSTGGLNLVAPIVSMALDPRGSGYWLVGSDGGVFAFGDAQYYGSATNLRLETPIVSIASDPFGFGYWLLGADGGVFSFGYSKFYGAQ